MQELKPWIIGGFFFENYRLEPGDRIILITYPENVGVKLLKYRHHLPISIYLDLL